VGQTGLSAGQRRIWSGRRF